MLERLARGLGNKRIAWELGLSEHTVKFHISSIYGKPVTNRTEAVRRGMERGLLHLYGATPWRWPAGLRYHEAHPTEDRT